MTKWVDQKRVEMSIITSAGWQEVLDELEKPVLDFQEDNYLPAYLDFYKELLAS